MVHGEHTLPVRHAGGEQGELRQLLGEDHRLQCGQFHPQPRLANCPAGSSGPTLQGRSSGHRLHSGHDGEVRSRQAKPFSQ